MNGDDDDYDELLFALRYETENAHKLIKSNDTCSSSSFFWKKTELMSSWH